ncbi:DnaJ domain-containing protein, partial [Tanacetum coccineum]
MHVDLLVCSDAIRPNACGLYIASEDESHIFQQRQIFQQDSFLYLVNAEVDGKKRFSVYPRDKEVWVLYKKEDTMLTLSDLKAGDCDIVEVCENNGDMIKVLSLSHVPGYKSVFKANKVLEIPLDQSKKFYYRIPAFLLTDEQDGRLRGMWELDLTEFP